MTKRMNKYSRKALATTGIMLVIGVLIWALMAFAYNATVATYSDATHSTGKTSFGRGVDTVYTNMTGGIGSNTYYAEYWGPSTNGGTDMVYEPGTRSAQLTSRTTGGLSTSYVTQATDNSGTWQARILHNPQYTAPQAIVMDVPAKGQVLTAGTAVTLQFHLVDRNGNTMTGTDYRSKMYTYMSYNGSTSSPGWRAYAANNSRATWTFNSGTGMYTKSFTPATASTGLAQLRVYMYNWWGTTNGAIETGDAYSISGSTSNDLYTQEFWYATGGTTTQTNAFNIVSVDSMNPKFVANPGVPTINYTYYFDIFDGNGNAVTSGITSWTNVCRGAAAYVTAGTQPTATVYAAPAYDATSGHWKVTWTLPAPGKYGIDLRATRGNQVRMEDVVQYAASSAFSMLGDVTPPANVAFGTVTPSDNRVTLNWTNPTTDQGGGALTGFNGIIILRNQNSPVPTGPSTGQEYSVDGSNSPLPPYGPRPNSIGTSSVVYIGNGTQYADGDPCGVPLTNDTITYYYKAYSFDQYYNYSTGIEVSSTPHDGVAIGPVTITGVTAGDQQNTINWINPSRCDFKGVVVRYSTVSFPTVCSISPSAYTETSNGNLVTYPVGTGVKPGGTPGGADSIPHTNLTNGFTYYYTVWAYDDEVTPLYSAAASPATYASPHDVTAPAQITSLSVVGGSTNAFGCTLSWTATGDDGMVGTATKYDIRYSKSPIYISGDPVATATNWNNAWEAVGTPFPQPMVSGTVQTYDVAGLSPLTQYYFAIRVADEVPNWSGVSITNASTTTLCNPKISACNQCHLMPPDDELPGAHPRGTGNIGNHDLPIHAGQGGADQCDVCHADGNVWRNNTTLYQVTHQNGVIDINGPGMIGNEWERTQVPPQGGTFYPSTTVVYKFKNYSSGVGYKQTTGYCQNTYCHGSGLSSPMWGQGTIVCGEYCHETPPATGRHVKHYHPGQSYVNFGPASVKVSGYTNGEGVIDSSDDGTIGWSPAATANSMPLPVGSNRDLRYATYISSSNGSTKTFNVGNGIWYVTVCVGDSFVAKTKQTVMASGDGGASWVKLIDNFDTMPQKLYKKAVDIPVLVTGSSNLRIKIGNGSNPTQLCYLIINSTPEAPKSNNTLLKNTATEYGFSCGKCHTDDTTQARHTSHVDGPVQRGIRDAENAFDGNSNPKNPLGLYTSDVALFGNISTYIDGQGYPYTNGRGCKNLYCHGSTLHAGGSNHTPTWKDGYIDVTGASICGSCHDAGYADTTPLSNITTGSHTKHTNNTYAYRFDCYKCHNRTVLQKDPANGNKIKIANKIYHVNGQADVYFDPTDNTMLFGKYSTSQKTCYNVYCHSNGLLDKADKPISWATKYATPQWASGSKTCNYCHGTSRPDGMPDYANFVNSTSGTPNSHPKHVDENKLGCSKCHYNTTRNNGASIYTTMQPSLHVNGIADVTFDSENNNGTFNGSFDHANQQCSGTYCHGRSSPPQWGGVVDCGSCHGVSPTNPNPGIGAHLIHNNGAFSLVTSVVTNASSSTTYNFTCNFCHFSRTHGGGEYITGVQTAETNFNTVTPTNGYNNNGATYTRGTATLTDTSNWHYSAGTCANTKCHSSNSTGGAPNNAFVTWTSKFVGTSRECYQCHNGDASAPAGRRMKSGAHAMHVFTSVYRRSCEECHALTASLNTVADKSKHVNGTVDVSILPAYGGTFDSSKNCSNVYCHSNANPSAWGTGTVYYKSMNWNTGPATTCTSCHSNNHVVGGDGVRSEDQTLSFNHRKHLNPATDSLLGGYGSRIGCTNCHNLTAKTNTSLYTSIVPSNHNNMNKDIYFSTSFFTMSGVNTVYGGGVNGTAYWGQWNTPNSGSCTVICHSDARGGDPLVFPNWSTTQGSYGCTSCHAADATTFALPNYTGNDSHEKHVSNGVTCNTCHRLTAGNNAGTPFINASGFTSHHVNGSAGNDVKLSVIGNYSTVSRSCSSLSCHGHRVWGQHYASSCNSCHAAPPAYAQHTFHSGQTGVTANLNTDTSNATTYKFGCGKCHTLAATSHNSGNVSLYQTAEVKFDATVNPVNSLGKYTTLGALWATDAQGKTYTAGTCKNLYCHSNGQTGTYAKYSSVRWNTTAVYCTSCHGDATAGTLSTPHNKHVNTLAAGSYNFGCVQCHNRTVASNSAISNKANHVNGVKDVFFKKFSSVAFGNKTGSYNTVNCSNTYCHSDGNGTSKTPTWASGTINCASCHNYTVASGSEITTGKHTQHIHNGNLGTYRCVDCHSDTVMANNSTIIYTNGTHVNGVKNLNFLDKSLNNFTGAYVTATKTCRNNYCHSSGQAKSGTGSFANLSTPVFRTTAVWTGGALDCKGCHGADTGFTSQFGEPNYTNRSTASRAWYNGHAKHVKSVTDCNKCHNLTTADGVSILAGGMHINGSRDVNFNLTLLPGASYNSTRKMCTVPTCHTGTVRWGGTVPNSCQSCHADMGAGKYTNHSTTGKHAKHTNSTTYKFACENCHKTMDTSGNTTHAGGNVSTYQTAQVAFRTNSTTWDYVTYDGAGTQFKYIRIDSMYGTTVTPIYKAVSTTSPLSDSVVASRKFTQGRCSNVWCHSDGHKFGNTSTVFVKYANWSTAETTNCRSCHAGDKSAAPTMSSGKHTNHINNGNLGNFTCSRCHTDTVRGNSTVYNYDYHVNGVKNINFTSIVQANYTGAYVSATSTCRNVYCHSSGTKYTSMTNATSSPTFRTPTWSDTAWASKCKGCHGADSGFTSKFGEPNYANRSTASRAWFNGHYVSSHVSVAADCFKCHAATVLSNGTSINTSGKHLNGFRNVSFTAGGTYDATNKRCSNTATGCHGTTTMRWGGTGTCQTCHATTGTEVNDYVYGNGTQATISMTQYTSIGHGRKIGRYAYSNQSGASSANHSAARKVSDCSTCHDSTVLHNMTSGATPNFFRLKGGGDPNALCSSCHSTTTEAHHNQANTGGNANWAILTPKCVDCHDPHGDTGANGRSNAYMIGGMINYTSNSKYDGRPAGTNGSLMRAVNFPANVSQPTVLNYTSFVRPTYDGLCQICHIRGVDSAAPGGTTSPIHFNRALYTTHNNPTVCTSCHSHSTGFQGAGGDCKGCHGTGGSATLAGRRDMQLEFNNSSSHHIVGNWTNITKYECAACHAEGNYADGSLSALHTGTHAKPVYLKKWNAAITTGSNGTFTVISTNSLATNSSVLTPFCLGCHSDQNNAATPFVASGDTRNPTSYSWDNNSVGSKYSNVSTTPWGKFNSSTYNVVPADQVTKAFSPHGQTGKNDMPKSLNSFAIYSGTKAVQCYDCHNAHASNVTGGTSYTSGNNEGGIIKTTSTYVPRAGGSTATKNAYSSSADLCFDCHLGENGSGAPKTYRDYGIPSGKAIVGYYDRVGMNFSNYSSSRWSTSDVWRGSFAYKDGTFKGGHFGNSQGYLQEGLGTMGTKVNGNCTACHDPHGVSPAIKRGFTKLTRTVYAAASTETDPVLSGSYTGTANASNVNVIQIVAGGALGTATYRASTNAGKTWGSTTSTSTAWAANGITATFQAGNYSVDDTWTFLSGANPNFMAPALKGTWMHSPYKEDRTPRNTYTTDKGNGEATARLAGIFKADDYTTYADQTGWTTAKRYWDDTHRRHQRRRHQQEGRRPGPEGEPGLQDRLLRAGLQHPCDTGRRLRPRPGTQLRCRLHERDQHEGLERLLHRREHIRADYCQAIRVCQSV